MRRPLLWTALAAWLAAAVVTPAPGAGAAAALGVGVGVGGAGSLELAGELAGSFPFAVRVTLGWSDPQDRVADGLRAVEEAAARGWRVVVDLRFQPPREVPLAGRAEAFAGWVGSVARGLGEVPGVAFEVTNRPNALVPDPGSDAGRVGVLEGLVAGVLAAARSAPGAPVGFSWLATGVPAADVAWWAQLGLRGGPELVRSVGFVGLQLYPGTLSGTWPWTQGGPGRWAREAIVDLRQRLMPLAGLGEEVPIWVSEFGFAVLERPPPAYGGQADLDTALRTEGAQARTLAAILDAVRASSAERVPLVLWARVADDEGCPLGLCHGLVAASGARRPAFDVFCAYVADLQGAGPPCLG